MTEIVDPGVYLDMPEADYHATAALSSGGIKWLSVSTMDYWARTPWLNPDYEPDEESEFQELGSAYHARILEGREVFAARYAPALDPEQYPAAIRTSKEMTEALKELGVKGLSKMTKPDLAAALKAAAPELLIWDDLAREHQEFHEGKTLLHPDSIRRIEIAAAMIEKHPDLSRCFSGGIPEITVIWNDEDTGVPCKARIDYLKTKAVVDLKTFSNPLKKSIDEAIYGAIATRGYYIQAAHYLEAVQQLRRAAKEGRVFGEAPEMLGRVAEDPQWVWVFQQTGIAPLARGKVFPAGLVRDIGKLTVRTAKETYRRCMETYGQDPWIDIAPIETLDDSMFPAWIGR